MGSTHLKAYKSLPQAEIVAVVSDIAERLDGDLSGVQGNIGGPGEKWDFSRMGRYTDPFEALRDPAIEAVDLCLPTDLHAPVAVAALKAGKHVLVEKPMALNGGETDAMIRAAEESGKTLMAAQVVRFIPSYSLPAEMVRSGKLGPVRSAIFRRRCAAPAWSVWLGDKAKSGGGVFDLLIHDIDYCLHLFGKPEAISAVGYEDMPRGIDWVTAQFHYPEVAVVVSGGWHHPKAFPFSMEYTIVADCGTIEFHSSYVPPTLYRADGVEERLNLPEVADSYQAEIEYFLNCCITGKKPEMCPPEESAAAVKLGHLIAAARNGKGERIACRL
jgi:predicted dehydrogenase